jgi:hypothetical protein
MVCTPFFFLKNSVCFITLTYLVPVLFTFYIQCVLKLKKNNSGAKRSIQSTAKRAASFLATQQQQRVRRYKIHFLYIRTVLLQGCLWKSEREIPWISAWILCLFLWTEPQDSHPPTIILENQVPTAGIRNTHGTRGHLARRVNDALVELSWNLMAHGDAR